MKLFTPGELPEVIVQTMAEKDTTRRVLSVESGLSRKTIDVLATGLHSSRVATVADAFKALGYDLYLVAVEVGSPRPELISKEALDKSIRALKLFRDMVYPNDEAAIAAEALSDLGVEDA